MLVEVVATPEVRATLDARVVVVVSSVKATVPVGVPVEETVAVMVTDWPYTGAVGEKVTAVVVAAGGAVDVPQLRCIRC